MLTLESEERDGHLVILASDPEIMVDGKPYTDWTVVGQMATTTTMMEIHIEAAKQRLIARHTRLIKSSQPKTLAQRGRVAVAPVIVVDDIERREGEGRYIHGLPLIGAVEVGAGEGFRFGPHIIPFFARRQGARR